MCVCVSDINIILMWSVTRAVTIIHIWIEHADITLWKRNHTARVLSSSVLIHCCPLQVLKRTLQRRLNIIFQENVIIGTRTRILQDDIFLIKLPHLNSKVFL